MFRIFALLLIVFLTFSAYAYDEVMPIAPEATTEERDLEAVPKASDGPKPDLKQLEQTTGD
jgi:hypothetical protein